MLAVKACVLEAWVLAVKKACVLEAWVLAEVLLGTGRLFKKYIIGRGKLGHCMHIAGEGAWLQKGQ